ncbi:MAG TPA: lysylphosphatidylglycerol synthase domain-containing protein [Thermomicrobiales bacterium]|nr:lysylphosphatidylglycerol synthase domain-containing protein [Thermomicrobiales bacterium]
MMTANTATLSTESTGRRRWVRWLALLLLLAVILLIVLHADLRALAVATWREMLSIPPAYLVLIVTFKVMQAALSSLSWRNALNWTWPHANLSYRFVVGIDQGQDIVNAVVPSRAGTWAMLGIIGLAIPGARAPKLLTIWGVQNLAFILFASVSYTLVAVGLPQQPQERQGPIERVSSFASAQPVLTGVVAGFIVILLIVAVIYGRRKLDQVRQQVREGLAILGSPARYVRLMFLPSLASYLFRCGAYVVMLSAFGIPVTIWTVALALGSNALAGTVRFTPGGLGTTQAIDIVALSAYAAPEVITAYSLSEIAITALVNTAVSIVALLSVNGWHGNRAVFGHLRRGEFTTGLHSVGARQRALRARPLRQRRRP